MSTTWTPVSLLERLQARGSHPTVAVSGETGIVFTTCAELATESVRLAKGL